MLTVNALSASDQVLILVQALYLPAKGMTKLLQTISKAQCKINSNLTITGVDITLEDSKANLAKSTIETIGGIVSIGTSRYLIRLFQLLQKPVKLPFQGRTSIPIIMNIFKKDIYIPLINLDNLQEMKLSLINMLYSTYYISGEIAS